MRYRLLRRLGGVLRRWDRRAAARVTEYVSISRSVQERVRRCYGRESQIIHPPVDTRFYRPVAPVEGDFYLWAGALALEAFRKLDTQLVVIGDGQDLSWARKTAPPNVTFLRHTSDEVLRRCYTSCRALISPGEEDFGIVQVEAQACGSPVIAYGRGGVLDTVVPLGAADGAEKPTGVFFDEPSADALVDAIRRFERSRDRFQASAIRAHALAFDRENCKSALARCLLPTSRESPS